MRRSSYQARKFARRTRRPAELLLVPMIDIFTVLVTFLLMTAVFSRTVILQLDLPASLADSQEPPPKLQLEVIVRKDQLLVADRNTGPLHVIHNKDDGGYDYDALTEYLKDVKQQFQDKTDASILLEPDTPYDILVQVMDHVRLWESSAGLQTVQAELFPDISIGDAPPPDTPAQATADGGASPGAHSP